MTWFPDTAVVAGVVAAGASMLVPELVARIPEPEPEPVAAEAALVAPAETEADYARPVDDPKEPYAQVAALPGLRWKCAVAGALAGAAMGGRIGWHPVLVALLLLVPVGVALSVVDWRTRYLPTRLIAPSFVLTFALLLLASALTGDWHRMLVAVLGSVVSFAVFFVLWFVYPRGMGFGDVRLSGLLALPLGWLGLGPLVIGLYTGFLLGGVGGALLSMARVFHRKHYPFGPFMVVGAWVAVAFTAALGDAYGWVIGSIAALLT